MLSDRDTIYFYCYEPFSECLFVATNSYDQAVEIARQTQWFNDVFEDGGFVKFSTQALGEFKRGLSEAPQEWNGLNKDTAYLVTPDLKVRSADKIRIGTGASGAMQLRRAHRKVRLAILKRK